VVEPSVRSEGARLTARGAATRERIVLAAAELMAVKGVAATTLDDAVCSSDGGRSGRLSAGSDSTRREPMRVALDMALAHVEWSTMQGVPITGREGS
jgi:hypothetical protein